MIFGSCHFFFHQLTERDKAYKIINDMNVLAALSATLIRRSDINCLDMYLPKYHY